MDISIGYYSLPVILTVILGVIYKTVPAIPDRWKSLMTMGVGLLLGIGAMLYTELPINPKLIIDYLLVGLMIGASAIGLYEGKRTFINPRE